MNLNQLNKTITLRRNANCLLHKLSRNVCTTNYRLTKNYYQILGVSETCTKKDLRMAYLNLCKQYHPDLNTDNSDNSRVRFQEINEAYNCLIKDDERRDYDNGLRRHTFSNSYDNDFYYNKNKDKNRYRRPYDNFSKNYYEREANRYYEEMARRRHQEEDYFKRRYPKQPGDENRYYGFRGIRKQPNSTLAIVCMAIVFVGLLVQYLHYNAARVRYERQRLASQRNARNYKQSKGQNATLDEHVRRLQRQVMCKDSKDPKDPSCDDLD